MKTPEEFLTRGKGNFINCTDYDDAIQAMKDYAEQEVAKAISSNQPVMRSLPLQEFIDEVEYMQGLYGKQRYTQAEQVRDKLAEKLDDVMRSGGQ